MQLEGAAGPARRVRHPLRRLVLRAVAARLRRRGRAAGEAARPGPPLRRRRRAVAAHHRLRRRQGPGADPVQRRADLLRQRHRLLPRQAGARLRPLHLPARRRPPRLRRPAAGDGRVRRRRPGPQHRGPDRPAGQDHAGRRGARLSKRAGTLVTLDDLVGAIGVDALRYALARYPADSPLDPRPRARSTRQSNDNPVFYVQYAHARVSLDRSATPPTSGSRRESHSPTCSTHEKEGELLRALAEFPRVVASGRPAARAAPGGALPRGDRRRPTTASTTTAGCCRWATRSRPTCTAPGCCWSTATRTVLANGLGLLGVSAPERM